MSSNELLVSAAQSGETTEQEIVRGFHAILAHMRQHGLTDEIALIKTWIGHVQDPTGHGLPARPFGTFWCVLVADDEEVDRYIVRHADSVLNIRENVAVQEWLASDRHFHVIGDNFDHGKLILAGMWGGVRGAPPPLGSQAQQYLASRADPPGRTADQEFPRDALADDPDERDDPR